jgi:hypothetical protein
MTSSFAVAAGALDVGTLPSKVRFGRIGQASCRGSRPRGSILRPLRGLSSQSTHARASSGCWQTENFDSLRRLHKEKTTILCLQAKQASKQASQQSSKAANNWNWRSTSLASSWMKRAGVWKEADGERAVHQLRRRLHLQAHAITRRCPCAKQDGNFSGFNRPSRTGGTGIGSASTVTRRGPHGISHIPIPGLDSLM